MSPTGAERRILSLSKSEDVSGIIIKYVNRLSDLLFVLARQENKAGGETQIDW